MSNRWAIALAGGEGERLRPFVQEHFGKPKPKQYCAFSGRRSMLEESLDRIAPLVAAERTVTIIGRGHRRFLRHGTALPGRVIEQPRNRDTAPGIFLPAAHIMKEDPSATLLIFPSDHFIEPKERFQERVAAAADLAEHWTDRLILLGAVPEEPEPDYGWIQPEPKWATAAGAMQVSSFREKPDSGEADVFFRKGYLWNTMIMAVKARTLWDMGHRCLPQMMSGFNALLQALQTPQEPLALEVVYGTLEAHNFSKEILERETERSLVLPMPGVRWSDWGRPERIMETLDIQGSRAHPPHRMPQAQMVAA